MSSLMTATTLKGPVWSFRTLPEIAVTRSEPARPVDARRRSRPERRWTGRATAITAALMGGNPQWTGGYFARRPALQRQHDYVTFGTPADLYLPKSYIVQRLVQGRPRTSTATAAPSTCCASAREATWSSAWKISSASTATCRCTTMTRPPASTPWASVRPSGIPRWHLVIATKDAAVGHKIYLDGELKNSDTNTNNDNYAVTRMICAWRPGLDQSPGRVLQRGDRRGPHLQQGPDRGRGQGLLAVNPLGGTRSAPGPRRDGGYPRRGSP